MKVYDLYAFTHPSNFKPFQQETQLKHSFDKDLSIFNLYSEHTQKNWAKGEPDTVFLSTLTTEQWLVAYRESMS